MQIEAAIRHAISQSCFMAKHLQKQTANFYPTEVGPYRATKDPWRRRKDLSVKSFLAFFIAR